MFGHGGVIVDDGGVLGCMEGVLGGGGLYGGGFE